MLIRPSVNEFRVNRIRINQGVGGTFGTFRQLKTFTLKVFHLFDKIKLILDDPSLSNKKKQADINVNAKMLSSFFI